MKTWAPRGVGNDLAMAALVVAIVALMVLPLPPAVIDSLLALNLAASVLLLMTTLFIPNAVALSSFPSLLLFTTLFRLSLNIASTKAILLHADAGHVISAFGELVVGGNMVVGIVMFLIITVVQFIVIAKGAERVAEVGARFTLDAMPGQQMSIDADLRAGHISGDEAIRRRAMLAMESQLHGGMDGAMKFVKGDAIAGLVITLVNLTAGIAVGVMYHDMEASEAAARFAVLSIGDAMVSQIPSLFICVAAGVLTTRVADRRQTQPRSLGQEIVAQVTDNLRAMHLAGGLVCAFALVPGFPAPQFLLLGLGLSGSAWMLGRRRPVPSGGSRAVPLPSMMRDGHRGEPPVIREQPPALARPLSVRLSKGLGERLDPRRLDARMARERDRLRTTLGAPFPGAWVWIDEAMPGESFEVLVQDVAQPPLEDPAADAGPEDRVAVALAAAARRQASSFLGIQEVQWLLETAGQDYPGVVAEVQKVLPLPRIADVLRRLLEDQVSVRNMRAILEALIAWGPREKDVVMLTEYVRVDLGGFLAQEARQGAPDLPAILLDPAVEQSVRQCIKPTPAGNYLAMPPEQASALVDRVLAVAEQAGPVASLVSSMDIRRYLRKLVEPRAPGLKVYSYQELGSHVVLRTVGRVEP